MIRQQAGPQLRRRLPHRLQQIRRRPQPLRRQQGAHFPGQSAVQRVGRRHQDRLAIRRVPQGVAAVPEGGQFYDTAADADPHREQFAADALPGRRTEHHRYDQIGRAGRHQQNFDVHIGIKNAVHRRDRAARQQSQRQHTARQSAGDGKQQQRQPQELFLPAKGQQGEQNSRRQLGRSGGQKAAARQEHRRGIGPARQRRQQIASPPERHPRQPGRDQKEQIVHGGVQHKHAVHIDHCHGAVPLRQRSLL